MRVAFDCNLQVRCGFEIEAESLEAAKEKLIHLNSISDLSDEVEDLWDKGIELTDIDTEIVECDVEVKVTHAKGVGYDNEDEELTEPKILNISGRKRIPEKWELEDEVMDDLAYLLDWYKVTELDFEIVRIY